jgi:hypothetical protein
LEHTSTGYKTRQKGIRPKLVDENFRPEKLCKCCVFFYVGNAWKSQGCIEGYPIKLGPLKLSNKCYYLVDKFVIRMRNLLFFESRSPCFVRNFYCLFVILWIKHISDPWSNLDVSWENVTDKMQPKRDNSFVKIKLLIVLNFLRNKIVM